MIYKLELEEIFKFSIIGTLPSKKNHHKIMKTKGPKPKYFISPDDAYRTWETDHAKDLAVLTTPISNTKDLFIHYRFFPSTERSFDLSNKIESINDMMVKSGIIEDDNWKILGHYMSEVIEKRKDEEVEVIFYRKK